MHQHTKLLPVARSGYSSSASGGRPSHPLQVTAAMAGSCLVEMPAAEAPVAARGPREASWEMPPAKRGAGAARAARVPVKTAADLEEALRTVCGASTGPVFLEVFSGSGRLSSSMQAQGTAAFGRPCVEFIH